MNSVVPRSQQPPPGRRGQDLTNDLLLELTHLLLRFERQVMSDLDTIKADLADTNAALAATSTKVDTLLAQNDALIALTDSIAASLAAAGAAGQIPPATLSDILGQIDAAKTAALAIGAKVDGETAKVQTAIANDSPVPPSPPAPSLAPAPADPPAPDAGSATTGDSTAANAAAGDGSLVENGTETP